MRATMRIQKRTWILLLMIAGLILTAWASILLLVTPSQTAAGGGWIISVTTTILHYGLPALGLAVFLGKLGVPLPSFAMLLAAGALARQGVLDMRLIPVVAFIAAVLGDSSMFAVGYFARGWLEQRFSSAGVWRSALDMFGKRSALIILLTRFWFTPLALPVNLLAGGSTQYHRFFLYDVLGNLVWVPGYILAGYYFANAWQYSALIAFRLILLSLGLLTQAVALFLALMQSTMRRKAAHR